MFNGRIYTRTSDFGYIDQLSNFDTLNFTIGGSSQFHVVMAMYKLTFLIQIVTFMYFFIAPIKSLLTFSKGNSHSYLIRHSKRTFNLHNIILLESCQQILKHHIFDKITNLIKPRDFNDRPRRKRYIAPYLFLSLVDQRTKPVHVCCITV